MRRYTKRGSLVLAAFLLLPSLTMADAATPVLTGPLGSIIIVDHGHVALLNAHGQRVLAINGYRLAWVPQLSFSKGIARVRSTKHGKTIVVNYVNPDPKHSHVAVQGQFFVRDGIFHGTFVVSHLPGKTRLGGGMILYTVSHRYRDRSVVKPAHWEQDLAGGIPYQAADGKFYQFSNGRQMAVVAPTGKSNDNWFGAHQISAPLKGDSGSRSSTVAFNFWLDSADAQPPSLAARLLQLPLGFNLCTNRPFNWWTTHGKKIELPLSYQIFNGENYPETVAVRIVARNFGGKVVFDKTITHVLQAGQHLDHTVHVLARARDLLFIRAQAQTRGFSTIDRTNLVTLPPHHYDLSKPSVFGLSAAWPMPSLKAVEHLFRRAGVRYFRAGQTLPGIKVPGLVVNYTSNVLPAKFKNKPKKKVAWIRQQLRNAEKIHAQYWEFGNEWNMEGKGIDSGDFARTYVKDWLVPIHRQIQETGSKVKIASQGIAGMDLAFVRKMYDNGGWPLIGAFSLHPGRGNFTPDYPAKVTPRGWKIKPHSNYWNYWGTIAAARKIVNKFGKRPIFLTEAYACTHANGWWYDSHRHAAENVVLSYALAMAEHIQRVYWYQLDDSVWYDKGGVDATNPEYDYGLLNRDLSFKAAMMAYVTASEQLSGATFDGWLYFKNHPKTRGLLFKTSNGPLALLWNRRDGYRLNGNKATYRESEPWIDPWKTKVQQPVPTTGAKLKTLNIIGQVKYVKAKHHMATLTLDGAPRFVRGLDVRRLTIRN